MEFRIIISLAFLSLAYGQQYGDQPIGYLPLANIRQQPVFRPVVRAPASAPAIEMPRPVIADDSSSYHQAAQPAYAEPIEAYGGSSFNSFVPSYFDYERGCCRRRWPGCRRPLCSAPGFDYYDEVHHCCHRRTRGCHHRPLCEFDFGYYNRNHHCCWKRTRGCHRPLCHRHRHSRKCHLDRSSRSNSHSRSNSRSGSHSRSDESRVHRDSGSRSNERSNYPAYFPYIHTNATQHHINQHVNVNVEQTNSCLKTGSC